jgi:probable phosphoglycerate mutase
MLRALRTCELCGMSANAIRCDDLMEWHYGEYEGRTTTEIRRTRPSWTVFHDGVPDGESAEDVARRAQRIIDRVLACDGDVLVFSHGHFLRVLAATWLELAPEDGERFALDTGTVSILGLERETRVVRLWNTRPEKG